MKLTDVTEHECAEQSLSEHAWLEGLRGGDDRCYSQLMKTHTPRLLSVAKRYLEEEDARDVVQEAFIKVYEKVDSFRATACLSTWLHRIVVNACISRLRKHQYKSEISIESLPPVCLENGQHLCVVEPLPEHVLEQEAIVDRLNQCLSVLPAAYRRIVMLRDMQGFSGDETAQQLGISANLVKVRLYRARRALRIQLNYYIRLGELGNIHNIDFDYGDR